MGSNTTGIMKPCQWCSVAVYSGQASCLTLYISEGGSVVLHFSVLASASRRMGGVPEAASWLEAGHTSLASAKLLAAPPQRCWHKVELLGPGGSHGERAAALQQESGIPGSSERTWGVSEPQALLRCGAFTRW